jgi:DNA-binding FrmR family transcriptional regulator
MAHVSHNQKALLTRARRIAGQVAGLEKALESGVECGELLVQIAAAKGAMHGLLMEVMAGHLEEHVVQEQSPDQRQKEAGVLLKLLQAYGK